MGFARALKDRVIAQKSLNPTYTQQYVVASERSERSNHPPRRTGDCFGGWRRIAKTRSSCWVSLVLCRTGTSPKNRSTQPILFNMSLRANAVSEAITLPFVQEIASAVGAASQRHAPGLDF